MTKIFFVFVLLFILFVTNLLGNENDNKDTIRTYKLGEIISVSGRIKRPVMTSSINEMNYHEIHKSDALSVADIGKYIPSALIQTNSRGETLLFIRGAGERQLGLFFDGILMNIPWDNRLDLSMLPTDIIGKIQVNKGASSILYGTNILGGAMNISTIERSDQGYGIIARLQGNDANTQLFSLTNDARTGKFNYILNITYNKSDGFLISGKDYDAKLNNQKPESKLRTNTDYSGWSAYLRGEYEFTESTKFGLSLNHINSEKGIAPMTEGSASDIRYWRYPEWKRTLISVNGEHKFSDKMDLRAVLWFDNFGQTINEYTDFSYKAINQTQNDEDNTIGSRITFDYSFIENHSIIFALNGLQTIHKEKIKSENEINSDFEQQTLSSGAEYRGYIGDFLISGGGSFDYNANPKTGIFKEPEGLSQGDFGAFAGIRYFLNDKISYFGNTSRRTRFPTMRESFSGALNKFKVNPDLKPETGIINEIGMLYTSDDFRIEITYFASFYAGLIEQIKLSKDVDTLQRKMRINLSEAMTAGMEMQFTYQPGNPFFAHGNLTYLYAEGDNDGNFVHLEYRPVLSGLFQTGYKLGCGLTPIAEMEMMGTQWGLDTDGKMAEVPGYILINLRLSYQFTTSGLFPEIYLRCNNMFDKSVLSKIGLPNAGRMITAGLVVRI